MEDRFDMTQRLRRPEELSRLVGQHPLGGLLLDEQP